MPDSSGRTARSAKDGNIMRLLIHAYKRLRAPRYHCAEDYILRQEWVLASEPCLATKLEDLEIHEELKNSARSALITHRKNCPLCVAGNVFYAPR